jgi:hypothetical protein
MKCKVLHLLRHDASMWWYYQTLRKQGMITEARRLERESIRSNVRFIRENILRDATTYRLDTIWFDDRPNDKTSYTTIVSNCHVGLFAAWVFCYAKPEAVRLQFHNSR